MATTSVRLAAAGDAVAFARIAPAYHADMVRVAYVVSGGDQELAAAQPPRRRRRRAAAGPVDPTAARSSYRRERRRSLADPGVERSSTMAKYLLGFKGGGMPEGEVAQAKVMAGWEAWFSSIGSAVADPGNPSSTSRTIAADGTVGPESRPSLSGYTILSAENLDAAVALARSCPVLTGGASIEVIETLDVM